MSTVMANLQLLVLSWGTCDSEVSCLARCPLWQMPWYDSLSYPFLSGSPTDFYFCGPLTIADNHLDCLPSRLCEPCQLPLFLTPLHYLTGGGQHTYLTTNFSFNQVGSVYFNQFLIFRLFQDKGRHQGLDSHAPLRLYGYMLVFPKNTNGALPLLATKFIFNLFNKHIS